MSARGLPTAGLLLAIATLGACGQTGPLYLPDRNAEVEVRPAAPPQAPAQEPTDEQNPEAASTVERISDRSSYNRN